MKQPVFLDSQNLDAVRNGDMRALADILERIIDVHNQQAQALAARIGGWKKPDYLAADYSAVGATWTVDASDVKESEWLVVDDVMFFHGAIEATALSADSSTLTIKLPGGYLLQSGSDARGSLAYNQGNPLAADVGHCFCRPAFSQSLLGLSRRTGADWQTASIQIDVYFAIWLHIAQPSGN